MTQQMKSPQLSKTWSMNETNERPKFVQTSEEDKKWLEEKFRPFKISDQDRIKAICNKLKNHLSTSTDNLIDLLEELEELMEI
jgi:hypothetical protein